jgi:hypothetical protein
MGAGRLAPWGSTGQAGETNQPPSEESTHAHQPHHRAVTGLLALAVPAGAAAQPVPEHASCAGFGANVADLARTLGAGFGSTASGVASSAPGAFPELVVRPEQEALCTQR